jgi:2-methylaconitate isomerase
MTLRRIPAVYMRGGTSKALVFKEADLPDSREARDAIFLAAMGVPDPNGRNLDGMGGGLSSLNKVCIVGPPSRADADVDYTFVQLTPDTDAVDYGGNCGNMSSAIGPFAMEEGLVPPPAGDEAAVRIHNTNTGKIILARFPVEDGLLAADGDFALDGVAGGAAPIRLEFLDPGGAKTGKLVPTGKAMDKITVRPEPVEGLSFSSILAPGPKNKDGASTGSARTGFPEIDVSCIDAANPCVFVRAEDVGKTGAELPAELEKDGAWLALMEAIRRAGSVAMGLAADLEAAGRLASIPKVAIVSAPSASDHDVAIRMISVGQPHRAVPVTGAICLAVAARIPGSIPHELCRAAAGPIRVGHPSGTTQVDAAVKGGKAEYGAIYRSARRLMEGSVVYRAP